MKHAVVYFKEAMSQFFLVLSFHCNSVLNLNSGLDASSSLELLNHLNLVAESGRLVILTIHQPRLEIFHLFHKILFLCDGQVSQPIALWVP